MMTGKARSTLPMSLQRGLAVALAFAATVAWAGPVDAHVQEKNDPNEVVGPLDLRGASFSHPQDRVRSTLTTQGSWSDATLDDGSRLIFTYDSRGNGFGDFYVRVRAAAGGGLKGTLFKGGDPFEGGGEFVARVRVRRRDKTLVARFPIEKLDPRATYIGWGAASVYKGDPSCTGAYGCYDVMPDGTFYEHNL